MAATARNIAACREAADYTPAPQFDKGD